MSSPTSPDARTLRLTRILYAAAPILLLLLMYLGFQHFYLHGKTARGGPLAPPIRTLIIAHGVAMTLWVILLVTQSLLVVNRKVKVHMMLGKAGAVLAAVIFLLGMKLAIGATRVAPEEARPWDLSYKQFMAVPVISITLFAGFVSLGIAYRRRPALHRPMMLLATLAAIPAATDRFKPLSSLYRHSMLGSLLGPMVSSAAFGALFLIAHGALTRRFDRPFAVGWMVLVAVGVGTMKIAPTAAWDSIANFLLRF